MKRFKVGGYTYEVLAEFNYRGIPMVAVDSGNSAVNIVKDTGKFVTYAKDMIPGKVYKSKDHPSMLCLDRNTIDNGKEYLTYAALTNGKVVTISNATYEVESVD
jgi:hypothetical protein